jgi:prefoldin subunit 5
LRYRVSEFNFSIGLTKQRKRYFMATITDSTAQAITPMNLLDPLKQTLDFYTKTIQKYQQMLVEIEESRNQWSAKRQELYNRTDQFTSEERSSWKAWVEVHGERYWRYQTSSAQLTAVAAKIRSTALLCQGVHAANERILSDEDTLCKQGYGVSWLRTNNTYLTGIKSVLDRLAERIEALECSIRATRQSGNQSLDEAFKRIHTLSGTTTAWTMIVEVVGGLFNRRSVLNAHTARIAEEKALRASTIGGELSVGSSGYDPHVVANYSPKAVTEELKRLLTEYQQAEIATASRSVTEAVGGLATPEASASQLA